MILKPDYAVFAVADNGQTGYITHTGHFSKYNRLNFKLNNPIPTFDLKSLVRVMLKLKNCPYHLYVRNLACYKKAVNDSTQCTYSFNDWAFKSHSQNIAKLSLLLTLAFGLGALADHVSNMRC